MKEGAFDRSKGGETTPSQSGSWRYRTIGDMRVPDAEPKKTDQLRAVPQRQVLRKPAGGGRDGAGILERREPRPGDERRRVADEPPLGAAQRRADAEAIAARHPGIVASLPSAVGCSALYTPVRK